MSLSSYHVNQQRSWSTRQLRSSDIDGGGHVLIVIPGEPVVRRYLAAGDAQDLVETGARGGPAVKRPLAGEHADVTEHLHGPGLPPGERGCDVAVGRDGVSADEDIGDLDGHVR